MSNNSESGSLVNLATSFDSGVPGHMSTSKVNYGSTIDIVPIGIQAVREHSSGCSSTDLVKSKGGKLCLDCSAYPLRNTTNKCNVKYKLHGIDNWLNEIIVEFSGVNQCKGEALYRVLKTYWQHPYDVVLTITSNKKGQLKISRSPNSPTPTAR